MVSAKKLMKMIQQWQQFAERISSPRSSSSSSDGFDSCCVVSSPVDKGHFAIYTADGRRFVVPLAYLNNAVFRQLLEMSEEEYGLPRDGPIVLPCDSIFMDYAICLIRKGRAGDLHEALVKSVARSRCSSSCLYEVQMNRGRLLIH